MQLRLNWWVIKALLEYDKALVSGLQSLGCTSYINVLFSQLVILSLFWRSMLVTHWLIAPCRSVRLPPCAVTYHISNTYLTLARRSVWCVLDV